MADETSPTEDPDADPLEAAVDEALTDAADDLSATANEAVEPGLQSQLEEANARVLRTQAELENFRKRMRREMDEERRFAPLPLMRDLLPVIDNLQRAIEAAENSQDGAGLLTGVQMVADQLSLVLKNNGCQPIEAEGEAFDPNIHEAIAQQPSPEHAAGQIMHVAVGGYKLHERVIRAPQVMVSTGPPENADDATADASNDED